MACKGKGKAKAINAGGDASSSHPEDENYKNQLNALCQRMTGESMGKTDIVYDTKETQGGFQATVTLVCLSNEVAAGEVTQNEKEAEQSAAMFCLVVLQAKLNTIGQSLDKPSYQIPPAVEAAARSIDIDTAEGITDLAMKSMLHETIKQAEGRNIEKGDIEISYNAGSQDGTYSAELKLPNVPGAVGFTPFIGMESAFKRDTQIHAFMQALDAILSDTDFSSKIQLAGKIRIRSMKDKKAQERESRAKKAAANPFPNPGKGKGWAKGKGGDKGKAKGKGKGGGKDWETDMVQQVMSMKPDQLLLLSAAMQEMKSAGGGGGRSGPYW